MITVFLSLSKPTITEDDITAMNDVICSGWIKTGLKNLENEQKILWYC